MRLDLFLKLSRLVPRRTVAQEFCDKGLISVNGLAAKSAKEIKPGDEIEIRRRNTSTTVKVIDTPDKKQLSKSDAHEIFQVVASRELADDDPLA